MEYTAKELGELFGKTIQAAYYWHRSGIIQPVRKGRNGQFLYDDGAVQAVQNYRKKKTVAKNIERTRETLCWTCLNTYGTKCCWASAGLPVPGWKAVKLKMCGYRKPGFKVLSCPLYEKELFQIGKDGVKRRVNQIPAVNSR